jgi:hypothetical protein
MAVYVTSRSSLAVITSMITQRPGAKNSMAPEILTRVGSTSATITIADSNAVRKQMSAPLTAWTVFGPVNIRIGLKTVLQLVECEVVVRTCMQDGETMVLGSSGPHPCRRTFMAMAESLGSNFWQPVAHSNQTVNSEGLQRRRRAFCVKLVDKGLSRGAAFSSTSHYMSLCSAANAHTD